MFYRNLKIITFLSHASDNVCYHDTVKSVHYFFQHLARPCSLHNYIIFAHGIGEIYRHTLVKCIQQSLLLCFQFPNNLLHLLWRLSGYVLAGRTSVSRQVHSSILLSYLTSFTLVECLYKVNSLYWILSQTYIIFLIVISHNFSNLGMSIYGIKTYLSVVI